MSEQPPTPNIGLILPVPATGQPWSTVRYNSNLETIDTAFGTDRGRLTALEGASDPAGIGSRGIPAGSTSARDAFWGIPSDDPGGLALQAKAARWFNTDTGREETYYGKYDGSTNKAGWLSRGWYPTVRAGWNLIKPGSVVGSGVSIAADGAVNIAAATAISLNNIFWGLFTEYMLVMNLNTLSGGAASGLFVQLRGAGTDLATASYNWSMMFAQAGTVTGASQVNQTSWQVAASLSISDLSTEILLDSPAEAKRTLFRAHTAAASATAAMVNDTAGINTANTAYDGITVKPSTGSMTGSLKVLGLFRGGA